MNEEALQVLYGLAQGDGYTKGFDEFKTLMSENADAVTQMYSLAQGDGYTKGREDFDVLVGHSSEPQLKKKRCWKRLPQVCSRSKRGFIQALRNLYRQMVRWNHSLLEIFHTDSMEATICFPLG